MCHSKIFAINGKNMDVFKLDQSLNANIGSAPPHERLNPEVSFDTVSEFNLTFFDPPEEGTQGGFSDPGSVGSTSAAASPSTDVPSPQVATSTYPITLPQPSNAVTSSPSPSRKQGRHEYCRNAFLHRGSNKGHTKTTLLSFHKDAGPPDWHSFVL